MDHLHSCTRARMGNIIRHVLLFLEISLLSCRKIEMVNRALLLYS